jgi:hypothetical protein
MTEIEMYSNVKVFLEIGDLLSSEGTVVRP